VLGVRGPRERSDAARNRQQVLAAAERLFAERGFESVTMDEIAHAAGVGKGTLYRRYGDKGQLVLALMDACVARLQADLASMPRFPTVLDELKAILSRMVAWTEEHTAELKVISDQGTSTLHESPLYEWMHAVVLEVLADAIQQREVDVPDAVYAADALLATLDVDLYTYQRQARGYAPAQIEAGIHALVDGLRAAHAAV
jgi:AcrR family transcriptional regulator